MSSGEQAHSRLDGPDDDAPNGVARLAVTSPGTALRSASVTGAWRLVERREHPGDLVGRLPEPGGRRLACICWPTGRALVLGSAQSFDVVDRRRLAATGTSVVRRRSGGGAVYVAPRRQVWLDAFLPVGDPLLVADVGRTAWWLGELWSEALTRAAPAPPHRARADPSVTPVGLGTCTGRHHYEVHRAPVVASRWSRTVCFAGVGPGEVLADGRKLVGISQRRTRSGTWLHSMALVDIDAMALASMLALLPEARSDLGRDLTSCIALIDTPIERIVSELQAAFTRMI